MPVSAVFPHPRSCILLMTDPHSPLRVATGLLAKLKAKTTPAFLLPFLAGALVVGFFTASLIRTDPGSYADELGFTGHDDYVTLEETVEAAAPVVERNRVQRGESVYLILQSKGLTPAEIHTISARLKGNFSTRAFRPGQAYETEMTPEGTLLRFSWFRDPTTAIHVSRASELDAFSVTREVREYETRVANLEGVVQGSLSRSLNTYGRDGLVAGMKRLFSSRVDFRRDIQPGTRYRILFEEQWLVDDFISTGRILAVELMLPDRTCTAYRFTDASGKTGYYDEKGCSVERISQFAVPCDYRRVSSRFGTRIHPVTRTRHFHGGVDLAASTGTPVRATADGKIIFRGRKGPAGNMITIVHGGGFHSQYLHLSRFAANVGHGSKVRQGQVIGYVGSTGRSTGPHLDFRIIRYGKPINPLTAMGATSSHTVARAEMGDFMASVGLLKAKLEDRNILVARSPEKKSEALL